MFYICIRNVIEARFKDSKNLLIHTIMKKNILHEIMGLAWQFVKRNGFTMSEALKVAWANIKLKAAMKQRIVKFYFKKVDGSVREAYGTLKENLIPATSGDNRKKNDTVAIYFDTEKQSWRSFKKANLLNIA
jgi:hypothetical protein